MKKLLTSFNSIAAQLKLRTSILIVLLSLCLAVMVSAQEAASGPASVKIRDSETFNKESGIRPTPQNKDLQNGDQVKSDNAGSKRRTDTCAGVYSPGNPYPCCTFNNGSYGNCTFAAWYHAKRFWNVSLPTWGSNGASDAKNWFDNLKNINGYPTSPTPALYSIAVSSTLSASGHVAWVMEINNNDVLVYEQLCGSTAQGITQTWRPISTFNKGFVLSPVSGPSPVITQATVGPIFHSSSTQTLAFNQTNVNPGMRVVVIFPNGGRTTLKDGQLNLNGGVLNTYVTLGTAGTYQFQVFNENGKYSGMANVVVS